MAGNKIQVGSKLPDATLRMATAEGPQEIKSGEWFAGKKVVLFAVPGAFTPTCHKQHLAAFVEQADAIKAKGVDAIACVAVNDPFVMQAWADASGATGRVTMFADGNADFSKAAGMTFDGSGFGLGTRSLRYAAVVDNGVIKALQVEESPGQCTVSSAPSILDAL